MNTAGWYPPANESLSLDDYLEKYGSDTAPDKGPWLFDLDGEI